MSYSKKVECVICDYGGRHMFNPCDDETKKEFKSLWTIYHKMIQVEAREPSVCHVNDFSHRDSPVFYSFCNFCLPHVSRLCDLYYQIDKQIELIWAIPKLTDSSDARNNNNDNVSEPSQIDVNQSTSGPDGNNPKRLKLTNGPVSAQKNSSINSLDDGLSDVSSLASDKIVREDDEIVILEKSVCAQNKDVQMVSIDSSDDEEEEENLGFVVKQLDSTDYLFRYRNVKYFFKRSQCLLKFECSMCSAHAKNITGIINHLWTIHCDDGKVKALPNYRIDVSNVHSSTRQSSVDKENTDIDTEESSSSEPEIINDNSSAILVTQSNKNVYHKRDLVFIRTTNGMYHCSFCRLSVVKHEIVSHTNSCLPKKLGQKSATTRKILIPPKDDLPISHILYHNGWPYCSKFYCAVEDCEFEDKTQNQLFIHLRRAHAGIVVGLHSCPHCNHQRFKKQNDLWDHIYEEHNRTHLT